MQPSELAAARYKRNHEFMAEIFTPVTTSAVLRSEAEREAASTHGGLFSASIAALEAKEAELIESIARLEAQHVATIADIKSKSDTFSSEVSVLEKPHSLAELASLVHASKLGAVLEVDARPSFTMKIEPLK